VVVVVVVVAVGLRLVLSSRSLRASEPGQEVGTSSSQSVCDPPSHLCLSCCEVVDEVELLVARHNHLGQRTHTLGLVKEGLREGGGEGGRGGGCVGGLGRGVSVWGVCVGDWGGGVQGSYYGLYSKARLSVGQRSTDRCGAAKAGALRH